MTTAKERELMCEIMNLACDVTLDGGAHTVIASYLGHIHAFEMRVLRGTAQINGSSDWAHLSGRMEIWTAEESIERLEQMLVEVKTYHPQYDADGVKL